MREAYVGAVVATAVVAVGELEQNRAAAPGRARQREGKIVPAGVTVVQARDDRGVEGRDSGASATARAVPPTRRQREAALEPVTQRPQRGAWMTPRAKRAARAPSAIA